MDLSRYKEIVLHIGGHDIDDNISQNSFKENFQSLLKVLAQTKCHIIVSGLLPRGGTHMKPFNDILKDLCKVVNAKFVDNHDSFIMASGELPFDFFHADKVNLKFSGTRKLLQNINSICSILPVQTKTQFVGQNVRRFNQPTHFLAQQRFQGSRRRPIYIN